VIPRIKLIVPIAVLGLMTAGPWQQSSAQSDTVVQTFYAIGLEHAQNHPYNFTGRVFEFNDTEEEIASATLLRRHTALTAAHVVFDPTLGFSTNLSFSRGLYGNYSLSEQQVTAVNCLAGYQSTVVTYGEAAIEVDPYDLGYLVITDPPVDSDWGVYDADPTQLTNDAPRFILGYPGETFDGRTMAYCVPQAPYVEIGLTATGAFNNDLYVLEPGFSGGPVYAVVNNQQVVVAEVTTSNGDTTGEFNVETVRAVDTTAAKFLQDAEYTNGLISAVPISGPAVAKRGKTRTYTLKIEFAEPNPNGSPATTNRYPELKLNSDTPGTAAEPLTTIKKISNTQFQVVFSTALRPGTTVNLTGYYDHDMPAPNSTLAVLLK
jgi:V8-like Glu-specific endopeptidase